MTQKHTEERDAGKMWGFETDIPPQIKFHFLIIPKQSNQLAPKYSNKQATEKNPHHILIQTTTQKNIFHKIPSKHIWHIVSSIQNF